MWVSQRRSIAAGFAAEWWERIEDSRAFAENLPALKQYHRTLQPGDVTLVGLIAEGGQGMRTARAPANRAAWDSAVHTLRERFPADKLRFGRMDLFRIAPANLIATEADYRFAFDQRKLELLRHWQQRRELDAFWHDTMEVNGRRCSHGQCQRATKWLDNEPLYCEWTRSAVDWRSSNPLARWQGHKFFLTSGVTWTAVANHVALKARYQEPCIFDADSMRLTPMRGTISAEAFLALLNQRRSELLQDEVHP